MVMFNPKGSLQECLTVLKTDNWNSKLITTRFLNQVSHLLFKAESKGLDKRLIIDVSEKLHGICLRYSNATQLMKACLIARFAFQKSVIFAFPDGKEKAYPEYIIKALSLESEYFKSFFSKSSTITKCYVQGFLHDELDLVLRYLSVSDFDPEDPSEPDELFSVPGEHSTFSYSEKQNILRITTDLDMQRVKAHVEMRLNKEVSEEKTPKNPMNRLSQLSPLDLRLAIHLYTSKPTEELKKMCEVYFSFILSSRFPEGAKPIIKKIRKGGINRFTLHPFSYAEKNLSVVVSKVKKLSDLCLRGCAKLTPETLSCIFQVTELKHLDLSSCVLVDDSVLAKIPLFKHLESLTLCNLPKITSKGIETMGCITYEFPTVEGLTENSPLPNLKHLEVDRKELLHQGDFDFKKQHPKTTLIYN